MEQHGRVPADIGDLLEQTSGKIAACKRGLEIPARVLDVLREDVGTLSTRPPTHSADSLSRKQRNIIHDLNIELMKDLQNIRSIVTQLHQHYQFLTEIILQVSMDLPAFLGDIGLPNLNGNFSEVTTVQQLLNLNSIEVEMASMHRRRLEREIGKIRARMDSGTGLSEIPPTLHRLQEATLHLTKSCLDKLKEFISVTTGFKEEPGKTWRAWIQPIENIRSELSNVTSSVSEQYNQAMTMADSL
ncbi:hypothetical protein Bbelb_002440 [Branchiostoma belcheri]|nr:hypothetical protein Bbelb_002440 [Branchiostoma belcheri]